jgi:hypothetical protein
LAEIFVDKNGALLEPTSHSATEGGRGGGGGGDGEYLGGGRKLATGIH